MIDSGALPAGWLLVPLGELVTAIDSGKSFKCEERPPEAHEVGVIKVSAVSWGEYQECESKTCVDAERIEPDYFVRPGDFLFSRANTIELVGACVIAGRVSKRLMLSDKILRLHFAMEDLKPWVLQYLRSKAGRDQIEMLASGNQESMRNIGQERLRQILIPLPPCNERESIRFKLDELLSELGAASEELSAAKRKLAVYRQSLLRAAVEGTLTAEWRASGGQRPSAEPAGQPSGGDELLAALPLSWRWVSISDVVANEPYSLAIGPFGSNLKVDDYRPQGVPLVFVRNVRAQLYGGRQTKHVSQAKAEELRAHRVNSGDVLVTKMGDPPGDADVYPLSQPPAIITADCIKIRCHPDRLLPHFLVAVINSPLGRRQIEPMTKGVAQKKVSLGRFGSLRVPLPLLDEQRHIVDVVESQLESVVELQGSIPFRVERDSLTGRPPRR